MRTFGLSIEGEGSGEPAGARRRIAGGWCGSWRWGGVALIALCLAVYVPGLASIPPIDRDESRFAMASWQMFTSGDYVVPRIQDRPRLNKPPLIYWLQCASQAVFGTEGRANGGIWVFRVPGVLAAITTAVLIWRLGMRMFDARAAWLGAALYAVCPLVVFDAHQARADQLLVTTVVAAQFALWNVWKRGRGWVWPLVFWLAIGAGIMTKGPITPMVAGLCALMLSIVTRRWSWLLSLRPALGLLIVAACVAPWVSLVAQRMGGLGPYWSIVYEETIGRSAGAKEGHWGPPGYHLVLLGVLFWPGSLLTAAALLRAKRLGFRRGGGRPAELFLLAWIVPSWIVFELVGTKLPHYTMPLYPTVALLSGRAVFAVQSGRFKFHGLGARLGAVVWCTVGAALVILPGIVLLPSDERWYALSVTWLILGVAASALLVWKHIVGTDMLRVHTLGVALAVCAFGCFFGVALPALGSASTAAVAEVLRIENHESRPLASAAFHEDSLIFLTRGRAQRINEADIPSWIASRQDGVLVVRTEWYSASGAPGAGLGLRVRGKAAGWNFGKGRFESLLIVEPAP